LPGTGKAGAKIVVGKFIRLLKSKQGFFSKSDSGLGQKKSLPDRGGHGKQKFFYFMSIILRRSW
jgi:hypothetical protein